MKRFFSGCNFWGWLCIGVGVLLILFNISVQVWLVILGIILIALGIHLCK